MPHGEGRVNPVVLEVFQEGLFALFVFLEAESTTIYDEQSEGLRVSRRPLARAVKTHVGHELSVIQHDCAIVSYDREIPAYPAAFL
jgi:hypothetical protein